MDRVLKILQATESGFDVKFFGKIWIEFTDIAKIFDIDYPIQNPIKKISLELNVRIGKLAKYVVHAYYWLLTMFIQLLESLCMSIQYLVLEIS